MCIRDSRWASTRVRARVPERPIPPSFRDTVQDIAWAAAFARAALPGSEIELAFADFSDARVRLR
eukprot:5848449-Alexandrium_andersonii.AAC.1